MSTMITAAPTASAGTARRPVWRAGLVASAAASVTTTVLAASASAAGVTFADATGASIPLVGFAQLTFVFSMIGVALAGIMARRARRPRQAFVRTTAVLTLLSCVPDATFGFDTSSAITLMTLHVVAAVIVVPTLARRLPAHR
ncbi:DUF6069 family protein [Micromonospora chersina]|uniref:DUF6069 family protein n=1 Tax=Micromonospora chersina TaxID=47854 RepID=UPI0033F46661